MHQNALVSLAPQALIRRGPPRAPQTETPYSCIAKGQGKEIRKVGLDECQSKPGREDARL